MKINDDGIWFPDHQPERGIFKKSKIHDIAQWNFVKNKLQNKRTVLDFGAHVGTSAIRYAEFFNRVVSFEPIPDLYDCLIQNTKGYENIETHQVAISNSNDNVEIWVNPINTGSSVVESQSTQKLIKSRWGNVKRKEFTEEQKIVVQGRTIDSFEFDDVDFVKIDTEGYSMEPLEGMIETLSRCRPIIQLEQSADNRVVRKTHDFLKTLDYKLIKSIGNPLDDIFICET